MQVSNIQVATAFDKKVSFQAKRQQYRRVNTHEPIDSFYVAPNRPHKKSKSSLRTKVAAVLSAAAIAVSGYGGYTIGKGQSDKDVYLEGYNAGRQQAYDEIYAQEQSIFMPVVEEVDEIVQVEQPEEIVQEEVVIIPEKVYALSPDSVVEFDLDEKPYLYRENMTLPDYFAQNGIDENVLKTAQSNCARVFKSGSYIILSPKQDVTMGELKRVFGILDGVIGKEPLNELQTRPQIVGSDGNLDNAILSVNDAIRIKTFDSEMGHQIGVYTAHKSNRSRQNIANEILKWASK